MSTGLSFLARTRASRLGSVALVTTVLALCGFIDYATGYEVSVFALYTLPIVLSMRLFGTAAGSGVAVLSAWVWIVADLSAGHHYAQSWVVYWNALHRLFFFMCVVVGFHYTQATLRASSKRLSAFSGPLPICTQCHRIGSGDGYWQKFESYLCEHGGAVPQAKVCPDCARERYAKVGIVERASSL
jgi:hypothetical protein